MANNLSVDWLGIFNKSKEILADIHSKHNHFLNEKGISKKTLENTLRDSLEKLKADCESAARNGQEISRANTSESVDQKLVLQKTGKYWSKEATEHGIWAVLLIFGIVAALMFLGTLIVLGFSGDFNSAAMVLLGIFCVWAIRAFVQKLLIQIRLERTTREQASLVATYLGFLKEDTLPEGYARDLILQILYSPIISHCVNGVTDFFHNE